MVTSFPIRTLKREILEFFLMDPTHLVFENQTFGVLAMRAFTQIFDTLMMESHLTLYALS